MIPELLEKLFGPNWRSSLSGAGTAVTALLAFIAALPYEMGAVAEIVSPEWKPKIAGASAIAAFILKMINAAVTKDAKVAGIGTKDDPTRKPSEDGERSQYLP